MSLLESEDLPLPVVKPTELFPIYAEVADDVLGSFMFFDSSFYVRQLNREVASFREENDEVLRYFFALADQNGGDPTFHGSLVMHRILREQAYLTGGRLPGFNSGFPDSLMRDRLRRARLVSESCVIPLKEVMEQRNVARLWWFSENEKDYGHALSQHVKPMKQEYFNDFYAGGVAAYYLFKDGLALPHLYS